MKQEEIRAKRPLSHGNVTCKASKAKESAEIEKKTKAFLKDNKITKVSSYE